MRRRSTRRRSTRRDGDCVGEAGQEKVNGKGTVYGADKRQAKGEKRRIYILTYYS